MRRIGWERLVPPGLDGFKEARRLLLAAAGALAWSVWMFIPLCIQIQQRGDRDWTNRWAVPVFGTMLHTSEWGFLLLAVCMPLLAGAHYFYHFHDGRSIYLMRRLPDRGELWRRCLTLPLTGLAAVLILTLGLSVLYFWLYETYALIDTNSQGRWYWTLHRMFYE